MDELENLSNTIWRERPQEIFSNQWRALAEEVRFDEGEFIVKQLHPAKYIYFLIDGEVEHSLAFEGSQSDVCVGSISERFFPLGWSGFSAPFRYATSAQARSACLLYRWKITELNPLLHADLQAGRSFFAYLLRTVLPVLADVRHQLRTSQRASKLLLSTLAKRIPASSCAGLDTTEIREVLGHSLFFEVFPESLLNTLVEMAEVVHYRQDEVVYQQGEPSEQLLLLGSGAVAMSVRPETGGKDVFVRSYSIPGQVVATAAFSLADCHEETTTAITDVTLLSIERTALQKLSESQPEFGLAMEKRLLWLLSSRLRTLRIQLVAQRHDQEHIVVQNLLSQVSPQLGVSSKLYKLPHLLASRLTHAEALACLQDLKVNGSRLERTLASVCLDLLAEVARELDFYEGLHDVYKAVTQAPMEKDAGYIRFLSSQGFKRVFENTRYCIQGVEHLPDSGGNIFILNHLVSHPYHALANGFEFALDTHFISAMILDPKYGESGIRVVRRGRGEEHGHHSYYDRLGHIYVYTAESDALMESEMDINARRENFTRTTGDYLRGGANMIVCPEGTSNWSEDSPSEFKKGTFHLAAALDPEPLIVPIAVANFDKRLKNSAFAAVVHEPFYITDKCDPHDKTSLSNFVKAYREIYRGYVVEAQGLAKQVA